VKSGDKAKSGPEANASAEALHKLRIVCKRFRYTLESFDLLYPSAIPVLRRAAELQDLLGAFHDDEVAARDLQNFATHPSTAVSASSAFLLGRVAELHRAEQKTLLAAFPKAYKRVTGAPWRRLSDEMRHERRRRLEEVERGSVSRAARDLLGA
jgi:CHAD domain-containing protein